MICAISAFDPCQRYYLTLFALALILWFILSVNGNAFASGNW